MVRILFFIRIDTYCISAHATIMPETGHGLMLDPEWPMVADHLFARRRGPDFG